MNLPERLEALRATDARERDRLTAVRVMDWTIRGPYAGRDDGAIRDALARHGWEVPFLFDGGDGGLRVLRTREDYHCERFERWSPSTDARDDYDVLRVVRETWSEVADWWRFMDGISALWRSRDPGNDDTWTYDDKWLFMLYEPGDYSLAALAVVYEPPVTPAPATPASPPG